MKQLLARSDDRPDLPEMSLPPNDCRACAIPALLRAIGAHVFAKMAALPVLSASALPDVFKAFEGSAMEPSAFWPGDCNRLTQAR
jgi:hypothetical protein